MADLELAPMTSAEKFPEIKGFNLGLTNIPHYPRETLDALVVDLQAAEVFVNSAEGAEALGLKAPTQTHGDVPEVVMRAMPPTLKSALAEGPQPAEKPKWWESLDLHQRLAVANALAQRRPGAQQATPQHVPQAAAPVGTKSKMRMPEKMKKLLHLVYDETDGTEGYIEQDEDFFGKMRAIGLDPSEAEDILRRMQSQEWVQIVTQTTFQLTGIGAEVVESEE